MLSDEFFPPPGLPGRILDVGNETDRGWVGGKYPVPHVVAMLVNLMIKTKSKPEDLKP
jgi:hypothetical protein